jgi:hypothetical protein
LTHLSPHSDADATAFQAVGSAYRQPQKQRRSWGIGIYLPTIVDTVSVGG